MRWPASDPPSMRSDAAVGNELLTLLHPPYTAWHLSYFVFGAAVAPTVHVDRLLWGLAAFALAVGVAAHALDELHDRPLGTELSDRTLILLAAGSLAGAVAIGVGGRGRASRRGWLRSCSPAACSCPPTTSSSRGGRFHSDLWFAIGWGAFPAFTGYFVMAERVAPPGLLIAAGCLAISVAQRRLSSRARELRRRTVSVSGTTDADRRQHRAALDRRPARPARRRARGAVAGDGAHGRGAVGGAP